MTEEQRTKKVAIAMAYLRSMADTCLADPFRAVCLAAIEKYDQGYGGAKHHHAYPGGLAVHVADVVQRCLQLSGGAKYVDLSILLTAAYWHDYGKLFEYELRETPRGADDCTPPSTYIAVTQYAKTFGHVVGSTYNFIITAEHFGMGSDQLGHANIVHCMLSHHGRKEWGSPVEPATNEAWILHSADMLSSRTAE